MGTAGSASTSGTAGSAGTALTHTHLALSGSSCCTACRQYQLCVTRRKSTFHLHRVTLVMWQPGWSNRRSWRGKSDLHSGLDVRRSRKSGVRSDPAKSRGALSAERRRAAGVGTGCQGRPLREEEAFGANQPRTERGGGRACPAPLPAAAARPSACTMRGRR